MKQVLLILDDNVEQIAIRTYHRDFPGAETWDVGSDHSLAIADGNKFDLRLDSKKEDTRSKTKRKRGSNCMRVIKASYMDECVTISGVLIKRFLRKPVFYASDPSCGWDSNVITKAEEGKVIVWCGKPHQGTVHCYPKPRNSSTDTK